MVMRFFTGQKPDSVDVTMRIGRDGNLRVYYNDIYVFRVDGDDGTVCFASLYSHEIDSLKGLGVAVDASTVRIFR